MVKKVFTNKEKNTILKEIIRKTNCYYEQSIHHKEESDVELILEKELNKSK